MSDETEIENVDIEIEAAEFDAPEVEVDAEEEVESSTTEEAEAETEIENDIEEEPTTVPITRFREVYYKQKEAERTIADLQAQQQQAAPEPQAQGKPKLLDYDDEEDFFEALTDYKLDQRDSQQRQSVVYKEQETSLNKFVEKQTDYIVKNEEYGRLVDLANRTGIQFQPELVEAVITSDVGLKIHHHLLANPEKIEELNRLSPAAAMRKVLALETKFSKKKTTSKAPTPITPNKSSGSTGGALDYDKLSKMSPAEYQKYMMGR